MNSATPSRPAPETDWYDELITDATPKARCNGAVAITATAVVQFGPAMIPLWSFTASPLISGTTSGTFGSSRKADDWSITTAPASAIRGEYTFERRCRSR